MRLSDEIVGLANGDTLSKAATGAANKFMKYALKILSRGRNQEPHMTSDSILQFR